ncbi:hypothetical protein Q2941_37100 [Bradyrhizobium sp. UFLA05-153]
MLKMIIFGVDLAEAHGAHVIGLVATLSDATSIQHDTFDVAVIGLNLRGHSACPIVDELMRVGKPFVLTTTYGVGAIPDSFGMPDDERTYELRMSWPTLPSCAALWPSALRAL